MNCIEACRLEDRKSGRPSAKSLWLQHDNTVKELKNQLSGILLSALSKTKSTAKQDSTCFLLDIRMKT